MMKKALLLASLAAVCLAAPAAAETFTTENGVFSIETPNDEWKQMSDPAKLLALSDGNDVLTVEHFANGEDLPEMSVANDDYANVYQAVYSTKNEVFIITGFAADEEDIPELCNMIMSAKVLKYDTKTAVKKEEAKASEISIVPVDETMYVTANSLNVRLGCSTDDKSIGSLANGTAVKVKGRVQKNGADIGWVQIEFNGSTGYVSASFLSKEAPKKEEKKAEIQPTGESFLVYWPDGYSELLTPYSDGFFYRQDGQRFTDNGNYTYTGPDGTVVTTEPVIPASEAAEPEVSEPETTEPEAAEPAVSESVVPDKRLESQGSGRPVIIHFYGGTWFDEEDHEFADQNDGTFIEVETGDVYNFVEDIVNE